VSKFQNGRKAATTHDVQCHKMWFVIYRYVINCCISHSWHIFGTQQWQNKERWKKEEMKI